MAGPHRLRARVGTVPRGKGSLTQKTTRPQGELAPPHHGSARPGFTNKGPRTGSHGLVCPPVLKDNLSDTAEVTSQAREPSKMILSVNHS